MTTAERSYPTRVVIRFEKKDGQIVLDQLHCIDKTRLIKPLGRAPEETCQNVADTLIEMFTL